MSAEAGEKLFVARCAQCHTVQKGQNRQGPSLYGIIGRDGKMPWHLPSELKYFRTQTLGKPVIMGRKTFQSVGKPLPGRQNIVITRDVTFTAAGATVVGSLEAALEAGCTIAAPHVANPHPTSRDLGLGCPESGGAGILQVLLL